MIIKHISKYFYINKYTYIFIILSLLTGSFHLLFIISFLLIIHELGHFITAKIFGIKVDKIYLYPFGGIAKFHIPLNYPILKELIILINGPLAQELAKIILIKYFPRYENLIVVYHYSILIFNLLPIYPLDGGKLINLIISSITPYKKSIKLSIIISYLTILILVLLNINNIKINTIIMIIFLIYKVSIENKTINIKYENFLLERYINNYNFKKTTIINDYRNFYKGKRHLLKINNKYTLENDYLRKKYKKS